MGDWQVMHTPGHTPGSMSLVRDDVGIVGDALVYMLGQLRPNVRHLCDRHGGAGSIDQRRLADTADCGPCFRGTMRHVPSPARWKSYGSGSERRRWMVGTDSLESGDLSVPRLTVE